MQHYFSGNWVGFALMVVNAFAAPIAEELVFRGLLLPRTHLLVCGTVLSMVLS